MRTIDFSLIESDPALYNDIQESLENGGIVCFPSPSGYKLAADLTCPDAVMTLQQAKRRVKNAPSLVLVPDEEWVSKVAAEVPDAAKALMKAFWPGPLTLLLKAGVDLHPKLVKPLTKAKGWLGVRMPDDDLSLNILKKFKKPLLVSSANLSAKHGSHSAQQVKKNFGRTVDIMVDHGDLADHPASTLVDMTHTEPEVIRAGSISKEAIHHALEVA
jgi:tRNA threonylcarbamoyl adenosine modification protein (Sua5/YciO/YrdC/YwlC family)